jgi:hypothetical protein
LIKARAVLTVLVKIRYAWSALGNARHGHNLAIFELRINGSLSLYGRIIVGKLTAPGMKGIFVVKFPFFIFAI